MANQSIQIFKLVIFTILSTIFISACGTASNNSRGNPEIILATTTSTYDSGLLDELIPVFEEISGYHVKTIAVGTGKALAMGEEGNADLLLVHAPTSELEFMAQGFGIDRRLIMHNDFVIVGPPEDPANIQGVETAVEAFRRIAENAAIFISRGDDSGTHKKELAIWSAVGLDKDPAWYLESGQGMGATLRLASEKGGYTLTDRSTFLSLGKTLGSEILVEADPSLLNVYHTMVVNSERWPTVNQEGAEALSNFLTSEDGQALIKTFGVETYNQPLFFPDAGKTEAELGLGS